MKVIDLLVNMANGEEVPKKIIFKSRIFKYNEIKKMYFWDCNGQNYELFDYYNIYECLNDEVEIIEELEKSKEIEKIGLFNLTIQDSEDNDLKLGYTGVANTFEEVYCKIDELTKAVNYLLKKE